MSSTTKASSHSPLNVPVLISGAGPTGLFAAILLTKLGHPCRIIERHFEISPLSKALVIHARTMEMFAFSGIIDSFISQGVHLTDLHVYIGGKLTSVIPTLRSTESEYTYGLFLEQLRTTAILTEELEKLGGHVDRGWELLDTKVVQDPETGKEHVETVIRRAIVGTNTRATESTILGVVEEDRDEEGKEYEVQTVRSQYLIATDGGKSVVRHKVDIGFPGKTLDNNIILIDCLVDSPISLKSITIVAAGDNHRAMAVFPVRGDVIRIILDSGVLTPEEHAKLDSKELTLEMCQKLVDECASPTQFRLHDPTWVTYYRVNERLAERFSFKNRIFLAGDAAHVHSPVGGQGMNTGLQDSYNLTWKLGLVLDGLAPESILETYDVERKPVAADIINLSSRGLDFGLAQDYWKKILRRVALTIAPYILPFINSVTPPIISMLSIRYHENALNKRHKSQPVPDETYTVGHRARDGELHVVKKGALAEAATEGSTKLRLHELTVGPGIFHVLVFAADMLQQTKVTTVKGIATTSSADVAEIAHKYLQAWRTKWAYKSLSKFSATEAAPLAGSDKVFMVHVIAADLAVSKSGRVVSEEGNAGIDALTDNLAGDGKLYLDQQGVVHEKYGVAKQGAGALVVVRPDGYLGYRVKGAGNAAWEDVDDYFRSILTA
ncbi:hypothetical protein MVEG_04671 [Podila verticillata NRRL 6337]|nr:hypothetical protein MVEG_04671 [Podila verticillata NRRL 6337]